MLLVVIFNLKKCFTQKKSQARIPVKPMAYTRGRKKHFLYQKGFYAFPSPSSFNNVTCCLIWFSSSSRWLIRDRCFHSQPWNGAVTNGIRNKFTWFPIFTYLLHYYLAGLFSMNMDFVE